MDLIESAVEGVKEEQRLWDEEGVPEEPRRAKGQVGDYTVSLQLMEYEGHEDYECYLIAEAHPVKESDDETVPGHMTGLPYREYESGRRNFDQLVDEYGLDE